jgi:hypothetical protein
MLNKLAAIFLNLFALGFFAQTVAPVYASTSREALARTAVSEDAAMSAGAIARLRSMGPAGLDALFQVYGDEIERHAVEGAVNDGHWLRLKTALDAVSKQYDSYASHLYWYTDLDEAKAAAHASGKPILSLRLLGNLNEEFSCANSRFFRAVLYANADVSSALRERFVLHWKSVRPAPRVTIDFGDGRKVERTITGNSIHYVLDADGRPVDAIPGLYGPRAFLKELDNAEAVARECAGKTDEARAALVVHYHAERLAAAKTAFLLDQALTGVRISAGPVTPPSRSKTPPTALQAAPLAMTKSIGEIRTVRAIDASRLLSQASSSDDVAWTRVASLHQRDALLDNRSLAFIHSQHPYTYRATGAAVSTNDAARSFTRVIAKLQQNIAIDTVRNEYLFHYKLHEWFLSGLVNDVEKLNLQVYDELFRTPNSDPWLGLVSPDTYTGLLNDGVIEK